MKPKSLHLRPSSRNLFLRNDLSLTFLVPSELAPKTCPYHLEHGRLTHWSCSLVTAWLHFLSPPRLSMYCRLAKPPVVCFWSHNSLSLQLFTVIGNVRATLYHVLLPHLEGIQVQKFMFFMTDALLNSEGYL